MIPRAKNKNNHHTDDDCKDGDNNISTKRSNNNSCSNANNRGVLHGLPALISHGDRWHDP